jgi:leucyl aminopeptidase (aminopeptidase T)
MTDAPSSLQRDAARTIVTKYLRVRPGENAIVESWNHTMPFATAVADEVRRVGGSVLFDYEDEATWWRAIDRKQSALLGKSSRPEWAALRAADLYVNFWGPGDTDRIEKLPQKTFFQALDWNSNWYEVARKAGLRGVRMTAGFVTEGRARQWGQDLGRWEEHMLRACLVDPTETARRGARLAKVLARGKEVRITHANGTDLEVGLLGVAPRVLDGRAPPYRKGDSPSGMLQQVPAGSVGVALDSRTAKGSFRANRRTNIWWSWHAGGALEFRDGKMISHSGAEGIDPFATDYKVATAGKDRASALTFGLNPAVRDVPNLETVEGGNITLQLGGNRFQNGNNRSTFFEWFSLAGAEVAIDGAPVVRDGGLL